MIDYSSLCKGQRGDVFFIKFMFHKLQPFLVMTSVQEILQPRGLFAFQKIIFLAGRKVRWCLVVDKMGAVKDNIALGAVLSVLLFIWRGFYAGCGRCRDAVG